MNLNTLFSDTANTTIDYIALRDLSKANILLTGADVLDFLHRMTTNTVKNQTVNTVRRTVFATEKGRIIDSVALVHMGNEKLIVGYPEYKEKLIKWLDKYIILDDVCIAESNSYFTWEILGPKAYLVADYLVLEEVITDHITFFDEYCLIKWDNGHYWLIGNCKADELAAKIQDQFPQISLATADTYCEYRVEKGILSSSEANETYNPHEACLLSEVNFDKGCYIGQEVIARLDSYDKVKRYIRGVVFDRQPQVEVPVDLYFEEKKVGEMTSVVYSSSLEKWIGLAYIARKHCQSGNGVTTKTSAKAEIIELPFIKT